ncbi:hypothetical protein [Polaromonas sp.]|uniref:hypothetical protein n=1 Tax=Polaromonas sp. TaxID=1869339 RepID=UPI003267BFBB
MQQFQTTRRPGLICSLPKIGLHRFVVTIAALFLTGCVSTAPLVDQLKTANQTRIVLVVDQAPFKYNVPIAVVFGEMDLLVALAQPDRETRADAILTAMHAKLADSASKNGIATDHHQKFVTQLVESLQRASIAVEVLPIPYALRGGTDRRYNLPVLEAVPFSRGLPVLGLSFDAGSCSYPRVSPCIRYSLRTVLPPKKPLSPASPSTTSSTKSSSDGSNSPPSFIWWGVPSGIHPHHARPYPSQIKTYSSTDDAMRNIREFDDSLTQLVSPSVDRLLMDIAPDLVSKAR